MIPPKDLKPYKDPINNVAIIIQIKLFEILSLNIFEKTKMLNNKNVNPNTEYGLISWSNGWSEKKVLPLHSNFDPIKKGVKYAKLPEKYPENTHKLLKK